jgi:hypothetical protein
MDDHRRPIILRGERAEFQNFKYHTEDTDMIQWLLNHEDYGNTFTSAEPDKGTKTPPMIRGAVSTISAPAVLPEKPLPEEPPKVASQLTEERVVSLIDSRLEAGFEKLMNALSKSPEPKAKVKRTFTCKDCGKGGFTSPWELGIHKKTDCPNKG